MMEAAHCAHCGTPIRDSGTAIDHGGLVFCCTNCAGAMEQQGSGSDPHAVVHKNDLRCEHCGTPIADESTMRSSGNNAYCCDNCLQMAA